MSQRQSKLLWMRDLIDHMSRCHEQLQWSAAGPSVQFLTETMLRDLHQCQRLCEELRPKAARDSTFAATA